MTSRVARFGASREWRACGDALGSEAIAAVAPFPRSLQANTRDTDTLRGADVERALTCKKNLKRKNDALARCAPINLASHWFRGLPPPHNDARRRKRGFRPVVANLARHLARRCCRSRGPRGHARRIPSRSTSRNRQPRDAFSGDGFRSGGAISLHPPPTLPRLAMAFFGRVFNYVFNELLVDALANSKTFQRFAVRTDEGAAARGAAVGQNQQAHRRSPTSCEARLRLHANPLGASQGAGGGARATSG